jgi:hypothetical protein
LGKNRSFSERFFVVILKKCTFWRRNGVFFDEKWWLFLVEIVVKRVGKGYQHWWEKVPLLRMKHKKPGVLQRPVK